MKTSRARSGLWLAAWLAIPFVAGAQSAQSAFRGRVVGPTGEAIEGITVILHRVGQGAGREVGSAVSDGDGRFAIEFEGEGGEGVYFAATRYEEELYVGSFFRNPGELTGDYVLRVGVDPVDGGPAASATAPGADQGRPWIGLAIFALAAATVLLPLRGTRRRSRASRAILVELAELEERGDSGEASRTRREALRARLRDSSRRAVHDAAGPR